MYIRCIPWLAGFGCMEMVEPRLGQEIPKTSGPKRNLANEACDMSRSRKKLNYTKIEYGILG